MKKTLFTIVTACVLLVFLAANSSNPKGNGLGRIAPNFVTENEFRRFELQRNNENYVLLTFWNSVDAESRIANVTYDRALKNVKGIEYIAINFDKSYGVYREMLKLDGVNSVKQFYDCDGEEGKLYSRYGLKKGMKSLLLDKSGKVIAENPTVRELNDLIH